MKSFVRVTLRRYTGVGCYQVLGHLRCVSFLVQAAFRRSVWLQVSAVITALTCN